MKKIFKLLLYFIGLIFAIAICAAGYLYVKGIPHYDFKPTAEILNLKVEPDSQRIARGLKISSLLCAECHSDKDRNLTGRLMLDMPKEFGIIHSYNITQDKTYGIGNWTDGELYYFLRTGIRKDGSWAPPYMPKFPLLADEDIYSIIAWLRSDDARLKPNQNEALPNKANMLVKVLSNTVFSPPPLPQSKLTIPDTSNEIAFGKYIADDLCGCFGCHSADFKTMNILEPKKSAGYYGGGNPMLNYEGKIVRTANITMDKETGIGNWSYEDFYKAVKLGMNPKGGPLHYPMFPHNTLTDQEVKSMYSFLKTVPELKNKVERYKE